MSNNTIENALKESHTLQIANKRISKQLVKLAAEMGAMKRVVDKAIEASMSGYDIDSVSELERALLDGKYVEMVDSEWK